jgi:hypothetical protein
LGKIKCQVVAQHLRAVSLTHTTTENIKMKVKGKEQKYNIISATAHYFQNDYLKHKTYFKNCGMEINN